VKSPFHEDFGSKKLDQLDGKVVEFDYGEVERCLGEGSEGEEPVLDSERFAHALRVIFRWITRGSGRSRANQERMVGRRTIALAWLLDPSTFEGAPSLARLEAQFGIPTNLLSRIVSEASATFGIRNRDQVHGWNRKPRPAESLPGELQALKKP